MRPRRGGRDSGFIEVELVEADPAPTPDGVRERNRPRLTRWIGIAVVGALAAGFVGVNIADARRRAALRSVLAGFDWVLPELQGPPQEVWRAPGGWLLAATPEVLIASDLHFDSGGGYAPVAATGSGGWSSGVMGQGSQCLPVAGHVAGPEADPSTPPIVELLHCVPWGYNAFSSTPLPGVDTTVVAREPATGAEIGSLTVEGWLVTQEVVGQDLLLVSFTPEGAVEVTRWDPRSGREVWAFQSSPGRAGRWLVGGLDSELSDGVLRLGDQNPIAIDVATGRPAAGADAGQASPGQDTSQARLPGGGVVEVRSRGPGELPGGRVRDGSGSVRFEFTGEPWLVQETDGSASEVFLVRRAGTGDVAGLDASTGAQRWAVTGLPADGQPVLQVDNVLVALAYGSATAIDPRDGTRLWQTPASTQVGGWALTDGEVVLLPVREGRQEAMAAFDLATGREAWRTPLPSGVLEARLFGDLLLLHTADELIAFR